MKTKKIFHGDEVTDFQDKKIPSVDSNYTCVAVIRLYFALKEGDNYYPQVFLKECKFIEKRENRNINDNLNDFSSDHYSDDFDEE